MQLQQTFTGLLRTTVLVVVATAAQAQEGVRTNASDADGDETALDNVTIIGRKSDAADVPGSAHVIDNEHLATFMQSDVMRVLRTVPGVYVQEEEGFGLRPNIGIRGSGLDRSSRIALLEDGIVQTLFLVVRAPADIQPESVTIKERDYAVLSSV